MIGWIDLDASRSDLRKALRGLVHCQAQGRYLTPTIPKKLVLVQPYSVWESVIPRNLRTEIVHLKSLTPEEVFHPKNSHTHWRTGS